MVPPISAIEKRKADHIKLCATKDVAYHEKTTLLECIELYYKTLPELSMNDVNLQTYFLGKKFSFPFMVSGMTGGAQAAKEINLEVAQACQELNIGMGVGSMRAMMEQPSLIETYYIRDVAPDIFLAGNIGAAQLKNYSIDQLTDALKALGADALAIHLNAAQEAVQPEGDADFVGLIEKIDDVSRALKFPVYVKEVGHGVSMPVSMALKDTNIAAIDVQGAGGTSWVAIELLRRKDTFGRPFKEFGVPTAVSILDARKALRGSSKAIIGSGGIRNGLDAAKALILGADMTAAAMPILKAQQKGGVAAITAYLRQMKREMEITAALVGARTVDELRREPYIVTGKLKDWIN